METHMHAVSMMVDLVGPLGFALLCVAGALRRPGSLPTLGKLEEDVRAEEERRVNEYCVRRSLTATATRVES